MEPWLTSQVFPSVALSVDERISSDSQNDFGFVTEYIQSQLQSKRLVQPNQRIKSAIKSVNSGGVPLLDVCVQFLREYIYSLEFASVDTLSASYFSTADKCRHLISVMQLTYSQAQLLLRCCSSTFQSVFTELSLMEQVSSIFEQKLFIEDNESLFTITKLLKSLSLYEELEEVIINLTTRLVSKKVSDTYSGNFLLDIAPLLNWASNDLYHMLEKLLSKDDFDKSMAHEVVRNELVKLRTNEIFDMTMAFPESTAALNELRLSITTQHQREQLVNKFYYTCSKQLLHAGTDTVKIIQFYLKTVRSFLVIDPRGVLLDKACRPIRKYLRTRDDTVTKIVSGLLDTTEGAELSELSQELYNTKTNSIDVDDINDLNWTPDPIDALPDFRKKKVGDLIESLFSIFDSKSVFMDAFFQKFSQDLINLVDYDISQVLTSLNFLKLRFGAEHFSSIDVMLQDIVQSATMDRTINEGTSIFHASIISHLYWPVDETLDDHLPPPFLRRIFEEYSTKFNQIKKNRKLKLLPSLGTVELEIEYADGGYETYKVSPDKASIIYAFSGVIELSFEQLAQRLLFDIETLKECLDFWLNEEVIYELSPQLYAVNENKKKGV